MDFNKITENESNHNDLEKKSVHELLTLINQEDEKISNAIQQIIPSIEQFTVKIVERMKNGGRLFYIGAGTSGRLGIVDASECPPTFGVPHGMVIGIIAGGDQAIRKAVEFAEDNYEQGWSDLQEHEINELDSVIGIAASGTTPYVIGALKKCQEEKIITGCIVCNSKMIQKHLHDAWNHGKRVIGNAFNHAVKWAERIDHFVGVDKRVFGALHPAIEDMGGSGLNREQQHEAPIVLVLKG